MDFEPFLAFSLIVALLFGWFCYRLGRDDGYERGRHDERVGR